MRTQLSGSEFPVARRRRRGCLGCLGQIFVVLIAGVVLMMLVQAVLGPYAYFYGGHFHIYGGWQGQGWIHDPAAGGDYFLWLRIDPTTPAYRKSDLHGTAYLCTPRGERFRLVLLGNLPRNKPVNTIGLPLSIGLHYRPYLYNFVRYDPRPTLGFYGSFADRKLVLEDRGSLINNFGPDGRLYPPHNQHVWQKRSLTFTLDESTPWVLSPPCPAPPSK